MLLNRRTLDGIATGRISLVFRRWKRPTVRPAGSLKTAIGVLAVESVKAILDDDITKSDVQLAGYSSRGELFADLKPRPGTKLYPIGLRFAGADPRIALREEASLTHDDVTELRRQLARFDKHARYGPWTVRVLKLIGEQPETLAFKLAEAAGVEKRWFKSNVRKLKELGLTESLAVGYGTHRARCLLDPALVELAFGWRSACSQTPSKAPKEYRQGRRVPETGWPASLSPQLWGQQAGVGKDERGASTERRVSDAVAGSGCTLENHNGP